MLRAKSIIFAGIAFGKGDFLFYLLTKTIAIFGWVIFVSPAFFFTVR
jgi:hypothetical protein